MVRVEVLLVAAVAIACATPTGGERQAVRIHRDVAELPPDCEELGDVKGSDGRAGTYMSGAYKGTEDKAIRRLVKQAAGLGADAVVLHEDLFTEEVALDQTMGGAYRVYGTAYRCVRVP